MVLLVAVDMGLQASSGCRGVVDATVGTGKQAAPRDGVDTFTPKCIEGLADMLAPYGLRVGERTWGWDRGTRAPSWDLWSPQHLA